MFPAIRWSVVLRMELYRSKHNAIDLHCFIVLHFFCVRLFLNRGASIRQVNVSNWKSMEPIKSIARIRSETKCRHLRFFPFFLFFFFFFWGGGGGWGVFLAKKFLKQRLVEYFSASLEFKRDEKFQILFSEKDLVAVFHYLASWNSAFNAFSHLLWPQGYDPLFLRPRDVTVTVRAIWSLTLTVICND